VDDDLATARGAALTAVLASSSEKLTRARIENDIGMNF
jgi:hypothetical protein